MSELRKLQLILLEILRVFDRICREHNLRYSLYSGTLLGAVRHKGFIPWDDDIDVCMSREDYEKFLSVWEWSEHDGYILQNKENTPSFPQSFSKIRKDHTTFLQDQSEAGSYHTGMFIDIFPIDRIPNGKIKRIVYKWHCMRYQLLTREFAPPKSSLPVKLGCQLILAATPRRSRRESRDIQLDKILRYNEDTSLRTIGIDTMDSLHHLFPSDMLEHYTELTFEDSKFMCVSQWEAYLISQYGDYMQLPPVEERDWKHHPIIIDFEHNYEELFPQSGTL